MSEITVSFCIASYNRREMTYELVSAILSNPSKKFEVVVMDDASTDGTISYLEKNITDSRLSLYQKPIQEGGALCWFDALENGRGRWLFQVIDRDWIRADLIDKLIETLERLEQGNVAFAVAGEALDDASDYSILPEGIETLKAFALRYSHPTGQIFRRQYWEIIENRREFFADEAYGIYPHGYLYAILGTECKGAYIHFDICDKAHYNERLFKTTSLVYQTRADKTEWFMPESRYRLLTLACEHIDCIYEPAYHPEVILNLYSRLFFDVTSEWYQHCQNTILKQRYHRPDLTTNYLELLQNGFDYIAAFRQYLADNAYTWADDAFYQALCDIDKALLEWLITWTNTLRTC